MSHPSEEQNHNANVSSSSPHSLLTKDVLEQALKNDLGLRWNLVHYEIKDFTKQGDNYQCYITGISCNAQSYDEEKKTFYVAKLNPLQQTALRIELLKEVYMRETIFLSKVSLKINEILKNLNCAPVTFPECVYFDLSLGREVMITRDLRQLGFRMQDKTVGLGIEHSALVLKGLSRIHASSIVLKNQLGTNQIPDLYPCFFDKFLEPDSPAIQIYSTLWLNVMDVTLLAADCLEGYEKPKSWIMNMRENAFKILVGQHKICPPHMRVICHGDSWYNNLLFRYNTEGLPEDVAFVDLQYPRFASPGLDLNNFIFTSVDGDLRKNNYPRLLSIYFSEFESVIKAANMDMPFTEEEFKKEVNEKNVYGVIMGILIFYLVLNDDDKILDNSTSNIDNLDDQMTKNRKKAATRFISNSWLKPKLTAVLDDIVDRILKE